MSLVELKKFLVEDSIRRPFTRQNTLSQHPYQNISFINKVIFYIKLHLKIFKSKKNLRFVCIIICFKIFTILSFTLSPFIYFFKINYILNIKLCKFTIRGCWERVFCLALYALSMHRFTLTSKSHNSKMISPKCLKFFLAINKNIF